LPDFHAWLERNTPSVQHARMPEENTLFLAHEKSHPKASMISTERVGIEPSPRGPMLSRRLPRLWAAEASMPTTVAGLFQLWSPR